LAVSDINIAQKNICASNLNKENIMKSYFEYTVRNFQEYGPRQYLVTMRFPKSMEKEVLDYFENGQRVIYENDSDWEIGQNWQREYFYSRHEMPMNYNNKRG